MTRTANDVGMFKTRREGNGERQRCQKELKPRRTLKIQLRISCRNVLMGLRWKHRFAPRCISLCPLDAGCHTQATLKLLPKRSEQVGFGNIVIVEGDEKALDRFSGRLDKVDQAYRSAGHALV